MAKLFANSEDPDQTPHSAASDLGLHCLPITLLGVSRLQWVNLYWVQMLQTIFSHVVAHFIFYQGNLGITVQNINQVK